MFPSDLLERLKSLPDLYDLAKSVLILFGVTVIGYVFWRLGFTESNIITLYILGVLITSIVTASHICGIINSILSVVVFNFFFTSPRFTLFVYDKGYAMTFAVMFIASFVTGTLAAKLKSHAKQSAMAAYRTKVLLDTNQLLQKAQTDEEISSATAHQLIRLLNRTVVMYLEQLGTLEGPHPYDAPAKNSDELLFKGEELQTATWVLHNNTLAGATTERFSDAHCLYLPISINEHVYGVVGIVIDKAPLDSFETNILLSILGECAFALENNKNAREKEEAAVLAKNEQLRANLLRSISHDLRTPLTSISGNASNLLSNGEGFDEDTKKQIYTDIYDDSMWLINLVENLLYVTRIEDGQMQLNLSTELMDEVVAEALRHISRNGIHHTIQVDYEEEFIFAKIDAKLLIQVIINIVDNAIKYTPEGSLILIHVGKKQNMVSVSISDNGPGIPDDMKPRVFNMFFTGSNPIGDSRRSLGLGLSLCKSIITAHGGEICLEDNKPQGACFTFTIPLGEVNIHE